MAYLSDISPNKKSLGQLRTDASNIEKEYEEQVQQLKSFSFDVANPYEDVTVNLQAARLQQEGLAQQQADILASLRGAGGGAGAAALATGLARQAAKSQADIAADIGQQEQQIKQQRAQAQFQIDQRKQEMEYARMQEMLGITMEERAAAELAIDEKEAERAAMGGAIGSVVLGAVGAAVGGPAGAQLGASLGGSIGSSLA